VHEICDVHPVRDSELGEKTRVSLHCEPGTITGFLGSNGAGKSTTLKMIVGLVRPSASPRPSSVNRRR
jgi:ABC-type uncharacterized transport system ATPase subunit